MRISLWNGIAISSSFWTHIQVGSTRRQLGWQPKFDVFLTAREHRNGNRADAPQSLDYVINKHLGCRSTGSDADRLCALEPLRIQLAAVGDQVTRNPYFGADLPQPVRIGTIGGAHHQDDVHKLT